MRTWPLLPATIYCAALLRAYKKINHFERTAYFPSNWEISTQGCILYSCVSRLPRSQFSTARKGLVDPLSLNVNMHVLLSVPLLFFDGTSWENLMRQQGISSWVIILMT